MTRRDQPLTGQVLDEHDMVTLAELCRSCTIETETVLLLVDEGVIEPVGEAVEKWRFSVGSLRRVKTVVHLQRDLGLNLPGAALAVELLERIRRLERLLG